MYVVGNRKETKQNLSNLSLYIYVYFSTLYFRSNTCGDVITNNCTYIENPLYPTSQAVSTECTYTVTPLSSDICQLRLDLENFDITEEATPNGACLDSFTFSGGSSVRSYYTLCGTLTGQHCKSQLVYVLKIIQHTLKTYHKVHNS